MPADPILDRGMERVRRFADRRRTLVIGAYLTLVGLGLLAALVPRARTAVATRVEQALRSVQRGWVERVDRGEALVDAGRFEEAVAYLTALDGRFPARTNRHALDRERERILHALGRAYLATDRKNAALDTYRRAVLFDPRNVENHHALARAALHFGEPEEALRHLDRALEIHPSHLGALSAAVEVAFEDGAYARVVERIERYLEAFRIRSLAIVVGADTVRAPVPVDGRAHELRVPLPPGAEGSLELRVDTPGLELLAAALEGRALAGRAGIRADSAATDVQEGAIRLAPSDVPGGVAAVRLRVRARVPLDAATWERARISYGNRLANEALEAAERRTVRLPPDETPDDPIAVPPAADSTRVTRAVPGTPARAKGGRT